MFFFPVMSKYIINGLNRVSLSHLSWWWVYALIVFLLLRGWIQYLSTVSNFLMDNITDCNLYLIFPLVLYFCSLRSDPRQLGLLVSLVILLWGSKIKKSFLLQSHTSERRTTLYRRTHWDNWLWRPWPEIFKVRTKFLQYQFLSQALPVIAMTFHTDFYQSTIIQHPIFNCFSIEPWSLSVLTKLCQQVRSVEPRLL